ncbi:MAG: cutinase family protein [Mycobacteriaceae bacterium]
MLTQRKLFSLLIILSATLIGATAPSQADPNNCPSLYVLAIPGTWETSNDDEPKPGMLNLVTDAVKSSKIRTDYVHYAATAFPWEDEIYGASKAQAIANGRAMLATMASQCPNTKMGIIGYSQGADAAGELAAEIGTGSGVIPPDRVAAVGLLSDPRRSASDVLIGPPAEGQGVGGPRIGGFGYLSEVTRTFCVPKDLYCATPKADLVTRIMGFVAVSSNPSFDELDRRWLELQGLLADLTAAGGIPTLINELSENALDNRSRQLITFYGSGAHQDYYHFAVDERGTSATSWLAQYLRSKA